MTEKITGEQALAELDDFSEEWVRRELAKGIAIPFRHWRGGHQKELLCLIFWRNLFVPFIFTIVVFLMARNGSWKMFVILFPCYILYWLIFVLIKRREDARFILKSDGVTIVTPRDKIFLPWEAIKSISSSEEETAVEYKRTGQNKFYNTSGKGYNLMIQVGNKYYTFYEVYSKHQVTDESGKVNLALIPLHIAYKLLKAAQEKVENS